MSNRKFTKRKNGQLMTTIRVSLAISDDNWYRWQDLAELEGYDSTEEYIRNKVYSLFSNYMCFDLDNETRELR